MNSRYSSASPNFSSVTRLTPRPARPLSLAPEGPANPPTRAEGRAPGGFQAVGEAPPQAIERRGGFVGGGNVELESGSGVDLREPAADDFGCASGVDGNRDQGTNRDAVRCAVGDFG